MDALLAKFKNLTPAYRLIVIGLGVMLIGIVIWACNLSSARPDLSAEAVQSINRTTILHNESTFQRQTVLRTIGTGVMFAGSFTASAGILWQAIVAKRSKSS